MLAIYPGALYWADDTAKAQLMAAYVRRKTWEAQLLARVLIGGGTKTDERIAPSAMIARVGGF